MLQFHDSVILPEGHCKLDSLLVDTLGVGGGLGCWHLVGWALELASILPCTGQPHVPSKERCRPNCDLKTAEQADVGGGDCPAARLAVATSPHPEGTGGVVQSSSG